MKLTNETYFNPEVLNEYLSASQYKSFAGTMGQPGCEAQAMASLRGEWHREMTPALMVGSYVDAHFEGTLDVFIAQHPDILTQKLQLKAEYQRANLIINKIENSEYFMKYICGEKQVIMEAEFFGTKWKCKIDSYIPDVAVVDLKIMKSLRESFYVSDYGKMCFAHYWGYDIQGAIYQEIVRCNVNKQLPFYIAGASKEPYTDIEIIGFTQSDLNDTMSVIESNTKRIVDIKSGKIEPDRCGKCNYCIHTKVVTKPIHFSELF